MSILRKVGVAILVLMLTTSFVTANAVGAAHMTVLDPDFVTTSLEEEGGYEMVGDMLRSGASGAGPGEESGPVNATAFVEEALTDEYIQSQTDANVHRAYAYLHGDTDELNLSISTAPIRENISDGFEREIRNASLAELVAASDAELAGPIDATTLERMTANRSSYREVKGEVRSDIREPILDEAVDRAFEDASNDDLIRAVGEDPDQYTEEQKERFVREHEPEIRDALRDKIENERGDEIDARVDDQLDTMHAQNADTQPETESEQAIADVQAAVADGLKSDTTYQEFQENLSTAKADLAAATAEDVDATLEEEIPDRVDLLGNQSDSPPEPLQQARTTVIWFDRLTFVLPVAIIGLVGLLYHVRRSVASVASDTGISMLLAGLPTVVAVEVGRSQLQSMVADAPPEQQQTMEVMVGILGRGLGTLSDLALVLIVGGVVLVGASLAMRYGLVDQLTGSSDGTGAEGDDAAEDVGAGADGSPEDAAEDVGDGADGSPDDAVDSDGPDPLAETED